MALLDILYVATFRGIQFLIKDGSTTGGRKNVTHEYPNSDKRYVEDLGLFQKVFTINGTVTGLGVDYTFKRDALIQALEQPNRGILSHPYYGIFQVTPKQYTVTETPNELGIAEFSMTFEKSDEPIVPFALGANLTQIAGIAAGVLSLANSNVSKRYKAPISDPVNFSDSQNQAQELIDLLNTAATQVPPNTDTFSTYYADLLNFSANKVSIFSDSAQLGFYLEQQFTNLTFLAMDPTDQLRIFQPFFNFNSNPIYFPPSTPSRIQRNINTETLKASILYMTLAAAYRIAVTVQYKTIEDLDEARINLEQQYDFIVNLSVEDDLRQSLEALRTQARIFFEQLALNIARIEVVDTPRKAITVFTYQYYASTDQDVDIIKLNDSPNPSIVDGMTRILSQ